MKLKYWPVLGALVASTSGWAITVNVTDFVRTPAAVANVSDPTDGIGNSFSAGEFFGTYDTGAGTNASAGSLQTNATGGPVSFTAYCAELTQVFTFGTTYTDYAFGTGQLSARVISNLSRLFTGFNSSVVDAATSAAMQAGIWEVIYEKGSSFGLTTGNMQIVPQDPAYARAFARVDSVLGQLSGFGTNYAIQVLASPNNQDFVVATAVPEPGTWALLAGGLAGVAFAARRRRRT